MEQRQSVALKARESQEIVFKLSSPIPGYTDPIVGLRWAAPTQLQIERWDVTSEAATVRVFNPYSEPQEAEIVCSLIHPPAVQQ
jgi:hypothetical protein